VGKPERRRPLGRPRRRWVDNIKMDLREIGWDSMDWIDLAQARDQWRVLENTIMNRLWRGRRRGQSSSTCRVKNSLHVQSSSGDHSVYLLGTWGSFPRDKEAEA
jgi:hypothetical protein